MPFHIHLYLTANLPFIKRLELVILKLLKCNWTTTVELKFDAVNNFGSITELHCNISYTHTVFTLFKGYTRVHQVIFLS